MSESENMNLEDYFSADDAGHLRQQEHVAMANRRHSDWNDVVSAHTFSDEEKERISTTDGDYTELAYDIARTNGFKASSPESIYDGEGETNNMPKADPNSPEAIYDGE